MGTKLTEAERAAMLTHARAAHAYIPPCPWNPFPVNSPWGRQIEDAYRRDETARRVERSASHADREYQFRKEQF